ncbi:hypothetical protein AMK59_8431 [Oryctes borbonicus]|uniref:Autophagy-related protein 9 n=1 Tax=Oryctes borbonicus TaxID=1629725 RepID=A0A0T6AWE3_9SCAR|nr:hypothetical protein AMK59_8431 [Oryctes borbonicus]
MQNYSTLHEVGDQEENSVLFHVAEPSRARWNHIEDLDSFFSRMYRYHQRHGFLCMLMQEILELVQFVFVVFFTTFLWHCVNYPMLFNDKQTTTKITLADVILPTDQWLSNFTLWTWVILSIAMLVWMLRLLRSVYNMVHFWDIKQFFNTALGFADSELENLTWHEVQTKVRAVQLEQEMCIHKPDLTELDIYHRILRQQNYLVAMTNKRLIPPRLQVPFVGEVIFWTRGLKYNIQLLLFWGPWAPFKNPWHLRDEYRKPNMRHELARDLGRHILWISFANLLLAPLIFIWQILYAFFSYAEMFKREPGSLGMRNWSMFGRMYLRHFNELDHELQARLCRAHRAASRYLAAFSSPLVTIIARSVAFMCGAILAVLLILTAYDEDVITVEHIITIMTALGGCVAICRSIIPDETIAWCPETLLSNVLQHTHYLPPDWRGQAHTARIRSEFQQLFQYKVVGLLEELLSPIITPYVLWKHVYTRVLDIVDFYRNFTVSVVGVGDVCSFAQMDVRRHGNPEWHETDAATPTDQYTQAEDGKTELSLVHFKFTNPQWIPPPESLMFVENVEKNTNSIAPQNQGDFMLQTDMTDSSYRGAAWKAEGPLNSLTSDMNMSTMYLHERHFRQTGSRYLQNVQFQQLHRPVEETTPLLFNR